MLRIAVACVVSTASLVMAADRDEPVRAKQSTVVTVRGSQDKVATDAGENRGNILTKTGRMIGHGGALIGRGIYNWVDGVFGRDNAIPASREANKPDTRKEQ